LRRFRKPSILVCMHYGSCFLLQESGRLPLLAALLLRLSGR